MKFYLGIHQLYWMTWKEVSGIPLFVSANRLRLQKRWPKGIEGIQWALDSGGFTEIAKYGKWLTSPEQYIAEIEQWSEQIGKPEWCAPQDWMCEEMMLKKTGKTVKQHQKLTTNNYLKLIKNRPDLPFIPVLQGFTPEQYLDHVQRYSSIGIDLRDCDLVGVGSVCRRQATAEIAVLMETLKDYGLQTHGFGVKTDGLRNASLFMKSSDSMAWSLGARNNPPLEGCKHSCCNNCLKYALQWRNNVLAIIKANQTMQRWSAKVQ